MVIGVLTDSVSMYGSAAQRAQVTPIGVSSGTSITGKYAQQAALAAPPVAAKPPRSPIVQAQMPQDPGLLDSLPRPVLIGGAAAIALAVGLVAFKVLKKKK